MEISIFNEYDKVLLGKDVKSLNCYLFESEQNEKIAIELMKYAFSYYLDWSPEDVYNNLTYEILEDLKLTKMLKYLKFPCELDKKKDLYYVACILYPKKFKVNNVELAIICYKEILEGKRAKFPKEYLTGQLGYTRAYACLQYLLVNYLSFDSKEDMYKFFASSSGTKTLKKYKLSSACMDLFDTPLDFLHYALPENIKSDFLYNLYKFRSSEKRYKRKMREERKLGKENS